MRRPLRSLHLYPLDLRFFLTPFLVSNHGSFYFNQIAALKILVGNNSGALDVLGEYFDGIYKNQIDANGEQPLEAERTRPYHYRAYNLAAMIVGPTQISQVLQYSHRPSFLCFNRQTLASPNTPVWTSSSALPTPEGRSRRPSTLR